MGGRRRWARLRCMSNVAATHELGARACVRAWGCLALWACHEGRPHAVRIAHVRNCRHRLCLATTGCDPPPHEAAGYYCLRRAAADCDRWLRQTAAGGGWLRRLAPEHSKRRRSTTSRCELLVATRATNEPQLKSAHYGRRLLTYVSCCKPRATTARKARRVHTNAPHNRGC